jgi:hypothetical protein
MPRDVLTYLTPADTRLVARAKKRGDAAANKVIQAIARRAAKTSFDKNQKIAQEMRDEVDRSVGLQNLLRPVRAPK